MMSDCFTDGGDVSKQSCDESVSEVCSDSVRAEEVQTQHYSDHQLISKSFKIQELLSKTSPSHHSHFILIY